METIRFILEVLRICSALIYAVSIFNYIERIIKLRFNGGAFYAFIMLLTLSILHAQTSLPVALLYVILYIFLYSILSVCFEGNKMSHLFATNNFIFHLLCIKGIIIATSSLYLRESMDMLIRDKEYNVIMTILLFLTATMFLRGFQKIYNVDKIVLIIKDPKSVRILVAIQMIMNSILLMATIIYYFKDTSAIGLSLYHLLVSILIIIGFYTIFEYLVKDLEVNKTHKQVALLEKRIDYEMNRYQTQTTYINMLRQVKHDFQSQLFGLRYVLENNGNESVLNYLNELDDEISKPNGIYQKYSNALFLDALLQDYNHRCIEKNIKFEAVVNLQNSPLSDLQVYTLFANLLNNAIEANEKVIDKSRCFINIKSIVKGSWTIITIRNSYQDIRMKNNQFVTTKADADEHGIGLCKIEGIIEECNGMVYFEHEEDLKIFIVSLMLPSSHV